MNKKRKLNIYLFFLPVLSLIIASCTENPVIGINNAVLIKKQVNFNKNFTVQLKINNISSPGFKTKASASGVSPKTLADIKSYSAYLTTNFTLPNTIGANPNGDGFRLKVNASTVGTVIQFNNIPPGGPYFAVISAFDDLIDSTAPRNITKPDLTLNETDKAWIRSVNSLTISPAGSFIFSDNSTELKAILDLEEGVPNQLDLQINVNDGSIISTIPIEVN